MRGQRMAAADAQFYWMSAKLPSDQFLLYAFAGVPDDPAAAIATARDRARRVPDLTMRVADAGALRYPRWVPSACCADAVRHEVDDWAGCLAAIVRLTETQLDAAVAPWLLHVFTPVHAIPGHDGAGTVVVLQIAHALADGARASALAAWMFGRAEPVPAVRAPRPGLLPVRAVGAARAYRRQQADVAAGLLPPPAGTRPALSTNNRPDGPRIVRTLVRNRAQLGGGTVTVAALSAVATALSGYLGEPCATLGAEVPMTKSVVRQARNHFGNVSVGLHPQLDPPERKQRIAAELADRRRRLQHPAVTASDRALAVVPAALLRWGAAQFDPQLRSAQVTGNTVVSSVYRGAADLRFGGIPVLLTAGFPALSPMMGLTHGVHGIGDTVVVSVHASRSAIADIDRYVGLLDEALR
ncbi:DUF1298 domain-containing protein [Mycobacterium sp. M1]|uniref:DUF1298 domain-containing protein n=1 Tax=Mycolicibacter acidiphilus TaxID=2835306 RepID=A0ABS5RK79_9MYCO|nr:WS/DGAT domain-containing protein [Mycolicibacter acidiphilus]MBS9534705.1 DUF1298 domain-containing protein [Mycolicibacter acidiphilus]